ncbi:ATP-grasp domain-containing protein [Methylomagnum ishizawai]|uniref:ATP-grasp domain-containing protein n=2 Tax=Methylomagnum ishizawai TaxID=1760988 RepID=A0A1Y6D3B7_9GAMM|nr:ATP-grasp domain-containing protein [Methylomagnum ishizawai]
MVMRNFCPVNLKDTGFSILFSNKQGWKPALQNRLSGYNVTFGDFRAVDLGAFDLIIPLNLSDQRYLNEMAAHKPLARLSPSEYCMGLCNDKTALYVFLQGLGLGDAVPKIDQQLPPPYILKPKIGEWGIGTSIIMDPKDEPGSADKLKSGKYFKQEYIAGGREYATHIIMKDRRIVFFKTIEFEFDTDVYVKGIDKTPAKARWIDHGKYQGIFEKILGAMDYQGICCFDYKVVNDRLYLFEINPRYGGSLTGFIEEALAAYALAVYGAG